MQKTVREKLNAFFGRVAGFVKRHKKTSILGVLIVGLIIFFVAGGKGATGIVTEEVERIDLQKTVLATGTVTSGTDLGLSFTGSGIVRAVNVKVGDKVTQGKLIASLDNKDELASLKSAEADLARAKTGEIGIAEAALNSATVALSNTKIKQDSLVTSAYRTLLSSGLTPVAESDTYTAASPLITGVYTGAEGTYKIIFKRKSAGQDNFEIRTFDLETTVEDVLENEPTPLGTRGLFITFPDDLSAYDDTIWYVTIPNTKSISYITNYNAYQEALKNKDTEIASAEAEVEEKEANLDQVRSNLSTDVLSAEAALDTARAQYEKTILIAPTSGTITRVDIKYGEIATALEEVMVLQDVDNLYIEAKINETNIQNITLGQAVDVTFDAFGTTRHFAATISEVEPSGTIDDGVVNYKIKASIEKNPDIRPDMTANLTILVFEKKDAVVVPQKAIGTNDDGTQFVRVVSADKKHSTEDVPVVAGAIGDGNLVEIISGLAGGEQVEIMQDK
jgi:multidrug efflux pump subunit AcrA (membrane-fusion protein)